MVKSGDHPLVSIGVPAFNAERFLKRTLDSLLDQSLYDFELIISDNASTDSTQAICEDYVRRDNRVRYIRQEENIGAPRNWNVLVHEARGVFFKWASASDYCTTNMLERCVQALEANPNLALAYGLTQMVDEQERPIEIYANESSYVQERPSDRFLAVADGLRRNNAQCGVFRTAILKLTRLDRLYPSGDIALMAEAALYGGFCLIPEVLLFRRYSSDAFTHLLGPLEKQRIYDPKAKSPMKLIVARRHWDHFVSVSRAKIPLHEKLRAFQHALILARVDRALLRQETLSLIAGTAKKI